MEKSIERLLAIVSRAASFREATGVHQVHYFGGQVFSDRLETLQSLSKSVDYMCIDGWHFLNPLESIVVSDQMRVNLMIDPEISGGELVDQKVRAVYWSEKWVPIFTIEHQLLCVDLDPTSEGAIGQVIRVGLDGDERTIVADSVGDLFDRIVIAYEAGDLHLMDFGSGEEIVSRDGCRPVFFGEEDANLAPETKIE